MSDEKNYNFKGIGSTVETAFPWPPGSRADEMRS